MNEVIKNMEERRSVRGYKPDMIRKEDLDTIIEAGTYAATGMGMQSPIIVAVTDKATRDQLSAMNAKIMGTDTDPFYGAPVVAYLDMRQQNFLQQNQEKKIMSIM